MRQIHISNAKDGMILGESIIYNNGILLAAGKKLNPFYIKRFEEIGISIITIDDHSNIIIPVQECLTFVEKEEIKKVLKDFKFDSGPHIDIKNIYEAATLIVDKVAKSNNISSDLLNIRNDENYDYEHAIATAELSIAIAQQYLKHYGDIFKNQPNILNIIASAALLMNIGKSCNNPKIREKINIDKRFLVDSEKYNNADVPIYGYALTHNTDTIGPLIAIGILFSKTNDNFQNCPKGFEQNLINSKRINNISKILHIADDYTNFVIQKQNGRNIGPAEAMERIHSDLGVIYDKSIADLFLHYVAIFPIGLEVKLSNGNHAVVIGNNLGLNGCNYRPIVQTEDGKEYNLYCDSKCQNLTIIPEDSNDIRPFHDDSYIEGEITEIGIAR